MILDRIDNASLYTGLHASFPKAFEVLKDKTLTQKKDGKYPVNGDKIYYTIQRYTTKPTFQNGICHSECSEESLIASGQTLRFAQGDSSKIDSKTISEGNLEAHRKYIDIQFLLSGVELLGYAPLKGLAIAEEYNPQKDIAFFHTPEEITTVKLEPGLFCILFPHDAHIPGCQFDGPSDVLKVVIKVRFKKL
jgi:beta-galactosidase beta subunit